MREYSTLNGIKRIALGAVIGATASCSQLPPHVSVAKSASIQGAEGIFEQCGASVRFKGPPRAMTALELKPFSKGLTDFAKHELDGLAREEHHLIEVAVCGCADF